MKRLTLYQILFVIFLIPALCRPSLAHKIRIFAWQDGDNIVTESKFSGGRPAQNATVSVIELQTGQTLLSGTTDTEGLFSFPLPTGRSKELQIIVDGGDGHKNSWNYTLEDSSLFVPPLSAAMHFRKNPWQSISQPSNRPPVTLKKNTFQSITTSELTEIIEIAIEKKLAPIKRTLAEQSRKRANPAGYPRWYWLYPGPRRNCRLYAVIEK